MRTLRSGLVTPAVLVLAHAALGGCGDDGDGGSGGRLDVASSSATTGATNGTNASSTTTTASTSGSTTTASTGGGLCGVGAYWTESFAGEATQLLAGIGQDPSGNVLYAGRFLGPTEIDGTVVTPDPNVGNIFVAKRDANGEPIWAKSIGKAAFEAPLRATYDGAGGIYVGGQTDGGIDLGSGPVTYLNFIGRIDPDGNGLWSRQYVYAAPTALVADVSGDLIMSGKFTQTVDFGGGVLEATDGIDTFLVKLTSNGDHVWSNAFGNREETVYSLAVDGAGAVVLGGFEYLDTLGTTYRAVVAKRDAAGNEVWRHQLPGDSFGVVYGVTTDAAGNVLIHGAFAGSIDLGGGPLVGHDDFDLFVAKLGPDGSHVWSKAFGGIGDQYAGDIVVDPAGRIVLVGSVAGTIDFGGGEITAVDRDAFVAVLDADGNHVASRVPQGSGAEAFANVVVDAAGHPTVGGAFDGPGYDLGCGPLPHVAAIDSLVAKLDL